MNDRPGPSWKAAAALSVLAGLAGALAGCDRGQKPPRGVVVLTWRRSVPAGSSVSGADVAAVEMPPDLGRSLEGVLKAEDLGLLARPVHVGRSVRKGNLVRRADLVVGRGPVPAPGSPDEAKPDFSHLPTGEAEAMEAGGKLEAYLTTTRVADSNEIEDPSSLRSPGVGPGLEPATQPLIGTGMEILGDDVPGVFVPPGSRRIYGFRQKVPGGTSDNLAYLVTKRPSSVEDYYKARLVEAGYRLVGRGPTLRQDGGVSLVFVRGGKHHYFVNLHPVDKGRQTKIVLMIGRPEPKRQGGKE